MQQYSNEAMKSLTKRLLAAKNGSGKETFMERYNSSAGGHEQALDLYYKTFGKDCQIVDLTGGENPGKNFMDTNMGIDYIVTVSNKKLHGDLDFWVQERFRSEKFRPYQSISLINRQGNGNLAEVYKTKAQYLVYGYLDDTTKELTQCVVVDLVRTLHGVVMGTMPFGIKKNYKTGQEFLIVDFCDLRAAGLLLHEYIKS